MNTKIQDKQMPLRQNQAIPKKSADKGSRVASVGQFARLNSDIAQNTSSNAELTNRHLNQQQSSLNNTFTHFNSQLQVCLTGQRIEGQAGSREQMGTNHSTASLPMRKGVMAKVPPVFAAKEMLKDQNDSSASKADGTDVRPISGMISMRYHKANQDDLETREDNSNMLLVSDGSADI